MARYGFSATNYISFGSAGSVTGTGITVQCWMKLFSLATEARFFSKWGLSLNNHEWLLMFDSALGKATVWTMTSGGPNYANSDSIQSPQVGRWHHLLLRQDASILECYLDNIPGISEPARSINSTANRILVGRDEVTTPGNCVVAHTAIWNRPLDRPDIQMLAQGVSPLLVDAAHLRGYWPLDGYAYEKEWTGRGSTGVMTGNVGFHTESPYYDRPPDPALHVPSLPTMVGAQLFAGGVVSG